MATRRRVTSAVRKSPAQSAPSASSRPEAGESLVISAEIAARVAAFVEDLEGLVRRAALEAVSRALSASGSSLPDLTRSARRTPAAKPTSGRGTPAAGQGRIRRSGGELEGLRRRILEEVGANPGCRIGSLASALDMDSKALALPVRRLVQDKLLRTKGQRRATAYYLA